MCKMTVYQWLIFVFLISKDAFALNVTLTIIPEIVERTHSAILNCSYDLEGPGLYYVKWYRGTHEFYRYTPSEPLRFKVFNDYPGINVDLNSSNSTQVTLLDIDFPIAGNFSCEIVTSRQPPDVVSNEKNMRVVQLPEHPPQISVGREVLDYGDILRANCSSPQALPPAHLVFVLNNITVAFMDSWAPPKSPVPQWSDLSLTLQLKKHHFNNGRLLLKCVAHVFDIYKEEAVLQLGSARDPVPQRVIAPSRACLVLGHTAVQAFLLVFVLRA